jgi:hypothetical protein
MSLIDIEGAFDQFKIRRLRHQLVNHPLLTTESLIALAMRMDPDYVRFHDGKRNLGTNMGRMLHTDPTRESLRHATDNLGSMNSFIQILNVCSDPAFSALLDDVFNELLPLLSVRDRRLLNRDAAVFLASPRSVTPFHLDHEQNFVCHIRGPKTFYVWDHRDRSAVSEEVLEVFYRRGKIRDLSYDAGVQANALTVEFQPGDCLYMPMGSPHAAATGDDITVTFSVLMNTRSAFDTIETYRVNHALRTLGLSPTPVGESWLRDSLKRHTLGAARQVRALARGRMGKEEPHLNWY